MSPTQIKFVQLERKKEEVKAYFDQLSEAVNAVAKEIGINSLFQDEHGIVYKIVEPAGRFVNYEKISYVRTKRSHEKNGTLSVKEAEEAGFAVPKNK